MTLAEGVPAGPLRFGLSLINFGDFAEARRVADLARVAEDAGWDALLVWDHLAFAWGMPTGDPWTLVTAAALATERLLVGTDVAVVARERPLPFANRLSTIDRLSGGRVVLGVGIGGAPDEYRKAGEPVDLRERAALTDEMLAVLRPLLAGETVRHAGPSLTVDEVTLAPLPVQAPIPVWVGGSSRGALRRAARHDGWIPVTVDEEGRPNMTPDDVRAVPGGHPRGARGGGDRRCRPVRRRDPRRDARTRRGRGRDRPTLGRRGGDVVAGEHPRVARFDRGAVLPGGRRAAARLACTPIDRSRGAGPRRGPTVDRDLRTGRGASHPGREGGAVGSDLPRGPDGRSRSGTGPPGGRAAQAAMSAAARADRVWTART